MATARAFLPDLLVSGGEVHAGAALTVADGRVAAVGAPPAGAEVVRLAGRALLPGLVSAHGHSFQRLLRGRAEETAGGRSFWGWREGMYRAAAALGPDALEAVARFAFLELARAGVTCAGEFHYLHHDPAGRPYADPAELALRVVSAARAVGLRIVLLRAAYARAGHGLPLDPAQRRFVDASPDACVAALDRLAFVTRDDPGVGVGLAPHSVRACPADWIRVLAAEAERRGLPLHVHASEQRAEVEACRAEHGMSPPLLLAREGALSARTTLVHAIHVDEDDVRAIGEAGATVCACPTTERSLGDGVVPADRLLAAGARLALGVDSLARADVLEEAREVELHLRLVREARAVLDVPAGSLAGRLLDAASAGGMASLGVAGGRLGIGEVADFVVVDLEDPSVVGATAETLVGVCVFGASLRAVRATYVAGEAIVVDGVPAGVDAGAVAEGFRAVLAGL